MYISEKGGLRSEPPGVRGDDGGTPAHSNQYNTCSYDKYNCASAIVSRPFAVAFVVTCIKQLIMETIIKSIKRLHDTETGEVLNRFAVYTTDSFRAIKNRKNGFVDTEVNAITVYDSYLYSVCFDAVAGLKAGRIYTDLLNDSIDTDRVLDLLLSGAEAIVVVTKEDSENTNNQLGYYYKYDIDDITLRIDEFTNVALFELYRATFTDKSKAYMTFVAKMLGVFEIFESELS